MERMRLTVNNIEFVKVRTTEDGTPYIWIVVMKSGICDSREYYYCDKEGRTLKMEYRKEYLPKAVQSFVDSHTLEHWQSLGGGYHEYIYRRRK